MMNSLRQESAASERAGACIPEMQRSSTAKNIALVAAMMGTAISAVGCKNPDRMPNRSPIVANAKDGEPKPKHKNIQSMADVDGFRILTSTKDILGDGK